MNDKKEINKNKGDGEMDYKNIKEGLNKIDVATNEAAKEILDELKSKSETHGEVKEKLRKLERDVYWGNYPNYIRLFDIIKNLLEKEMNDLPLTNRSNPQL